MIMPTQYRPPLYYSRKSRRQPYRLMRYSLAALILAVFTLWSVQYSNAATREAVPRAITPRGELAPDEKTNIDIFKSASPSVVHITTLQNAASFFSMDVQQIPQGTGTGFLWDKDGDIVTNYHVIQGGDAARVTLSDQSTYKAILVGAFPDRDLAVLRISAPQGNIKPILVGTSADLRVGQKVYAIGNPFGLDQTLTTGIVSALGREIESATRRVIRGVIQTDAAINPGNSGGPLLDSAGRLIGVNTMIYSPSGASAGIGFAIPVDEINRVVPKLIQDGRYLRPSLGISAAPPDFNKALGLPEGVAVIGVIAQGPAASIGLQPFTRDITGAIVSGDIITAVNGKSVANYDRLLEALEAYRVGDKVNLQVKRDRRSLNFTVRLGVEG